MNALKFCYYLSDTGILGEESIENYGKIHQNIYKNKSGNNYENIKNTLNSYLDQKAKSKESLNNYSENIIKSFSDNLILNRYRGLNLLCNILFFKLREIYIMVFTKFNCFILKKYHNDNTQIKKGKIKKNKNYKDNNNEDTDNEKIIKKLNGINDYEIRLNYDYNKNKKPPPLDYQKYLRIKEQEEEEEKKRKAEKDDERRKREEEKRKEEEEMKKIKLIRKTFVPQIDSYSKEICQEKFPKERKNQFWNKNYLQKNFPEKKVDYCSLEKERLKELHDGLITKKLEKEKKEKKEKEKEDKKRKKLREKYKDIYDKKTSIKEYINLLYSSPKKLKPIEEKKTGDNKNYAKKNEINKFIKKEKADKTKEKDKNKVEEKTNKQKQEKSEENNQKNVTDTKGKEEGENKLVEEKDKKEEVKDNNVIEGNKEEEKVIKEKESLKSNENYLKESSLSLSLDYEKLQKQNDMRTIEVQSEAMKAILNKK